MPFLRDNWLSLYDRFELNGLFHPRGLGCLSESSDVPSQEQLVYSAEDSDLIDTAASYRRHTAVEPVNQ
jgi:hypothetical protein